MHTCPHCNETFNLVPDITTGEHDGATTDCPKCGKLLMIENGTIELPYWLKPGEDGNYLEICE